MSPFVPSDQSALIVVLAPEGERYVLHFACSNPLRWFDRAMAHVGDKVAAEQPISGMVVIGPNGAVSEYTASEAVDLIGAGVPSRSIR